MLTSLRVLNLESNGLKESIPKFLGNLVNLRRLNLKSNRLTEAIPLELEKPANLMLLDIGGNELIGELPRKLVKSLQQSQYYRDRGRRMRQTLDVECNAWLDEYDEYDEEVPGPLE